ncbi:WcaG Nucleoside-diphosphate-sugar epimerases [uncultured Caudovirales phage]|uniref:WcaG Nucleoside-diphosphate-sugar epimerases n=1 Tax=uncultured Caudovirales phage TaxID=2100421 RepID=A0A6J5LHM0_9CAUD|nr:WcaG Nucleoside-diphosphate-sugar epimerases [uncultured Caudovirales phage]
MKKVLVCGAGGFIGNHLVSSLKNKGNYVIGADLKNPEFSQTRADEFYTIDLRDKLSVYNLITSDIDEIYQLAADMGGAGFVFTGEHDADILHNSTMINLNILQEATSKKIKKIFYSSSACVYPEYNQMDALNPVCSENTAYPAHPDSDYGWEKLYSERLYSAYAKNYGIEVRIARFHNIYGTHGTWCGGREKAPAALCRKIAETTTNQIEIWGDGNQTRSFLYIDECIEGIHRIMDSDYSQPLNLGSDRLISINNLAHIIADIANKQINLHHIDGPLGVVGRNSNNELIQKVLGWKPQNNLEFGLKKTYDWIHSQL